MRFPERFTIYVPGSRIDQWHFVDKHPAFDGEDFDAVNAYSSFWVPDADLLGVWLAKDEVRLEVVARESVAILLEESFGVPAGDGWVQLGVHAYVADVLGWPAPGSACAPQDGAEGPAPELARVLATPAGSLSDAESARARDFVRYLFDGQPGKAEHVFRMIGRGVDGAQACERVLGLPIEVVEVRLSRWLEESRE
jgi:hypothetical protein